MFYLNFFLLKIFAWALAIPPRGVFVGMGHGLGWLLRRLGFRVKITKANLKIAFPELDEAAREGILRRNYAHLGLLFLEMFRSFFRLDRFVERFSEVEGEENLKAALNQGRGVFVMTAHLGNWEILSAAGPVLLGTGVTMVTKELKPKWLHRATVATRGLIGVQMACEPRTMVGIMRGLKRKEIVGFVMDQYTGAPVGARVPFFGVPVGSHTALAALALRTEAPVVPAIAYRKPGGRFGLRFEPALELVRVDDADQSILLNTANYVKKTESWVREFPDQWMWIHRRWKGDLSPLPPHSVGEMLR